MRPISARLASRASLLTALLVVPACGQCGGSTAGTATTGSGAAGPLAPKSAPAVVEGVVKLAPGAELPRFTLEQMERKVLTQAARAALPEVCSPPKLTDRTPVLLTDAGSLAGVLVAASEFERQPPPRPPMAHDVTIKDCRLEPRLIAAKVGDLLRIRNTVDYAFMPAYGPTEMVKTLMPGQTLDVALDKQEGSLVACGFTAPCGRTDVLTLPHSFHVVTDAEGRFRFDDFPADETITLSAWHPLFREASLQVTVGRGEQKSVELVLIPQSQ